MDARQLKETTMDPRQRTLRRIRIEDAAAATGMFDLLMGSEVAPRRETLEDLFMRRAIGADGPGASEAS